VATTMAKMTASMTAYSAMSCPPSSRHNRVKFRTIFDLLHNEVGREGTEVGPDLSQLLFRFVKIFPPGIAATEQPQFLSQSYLTDSESNRIC
jgi:hypothetical protein